jgi:Flp pilus assembly protein TadG
MAAVELAIVAPVLFAFVFGIVELSRMGMAVQALSNAARDTCRVAVLQNSTTADVQNRLSTVLTPFGISPGTVTPVDSDPGTSGTWILPSNWGTAPAGTPVTVILRIPFTQVSWISSPFYLKTAVVTGSATLSSEHP